MANGPCGVAYVKDHLSRFLFVSAGWAAAYAPGRQREELAGKTDFDVFTFEHTRSPCTMSGRQCGQASRWQGRPGKETYAGQLPAWVVTIKPPLRDERGQIIGTFGLTPRPRPITP
jgi:hypothetical protein